MSKKKLEEKNVEKEWKKEKRRRRRQILRLKSHVQKKEPKEKGAPEKEELRDVKYLF
tara:strand:- start:2609 stop:2779 length:171 start_codon:yes stop_codon:yes gene_type:complete